LRTRSLFLIALLPPGPQERELQLFASRIFQAGGDASALALPGLLPLALGTPPRRIGNDELATSWQGIVSGFSTASVALHEGGLYLEVTGPLAELEARARALLEPLIAFPVLPGKGFYMGKATSADLACLLAQPPSLSFHAASLSLRELHFEAEGLRLLGWTEKARAWRPGRGKTRKRSSPPGPKALAVHEDE